MYGKKILNYLGNPVEMYEIDAADAIARFSANFIDLATGVVLSPSPAVYQNTSNYNFQVSVSGGTVSKLEYLGHHAPAWVTLPGTSITYLTLFKGDSIRITYSVAPTFTYKHAPFQA